MALKHGILGILNIQPMTGYDLMKAFESSLAHFWHVQTSQIYLTLDELHEKGLVDYTIEIQQGKPNKKIFSINDNGKIFLKNWIKNYDINKSFKVKEEFLMVVFFLNQLSKKEALEMLEEFKATCLIYYHKIDSVCKTSFADNEEKFIFEKLTAEFGIYQYKAALEWVEHAIESINKNHKGELE